MSGHDGADGTWRGARGRVQLPLLDRLCDADPDAAADPPMTSAAALSALRDSVRRDLEALLNARRRWRSWDPRLVHLATSPLGYGLPDFAAGAFNDPARREALRAEVEACIVRFEPRFAHVRVSLAGDAGTMSSTLRLRVEALLHAEPAPEPVLFDTLVDAATTDVTVRAGEA